MNRFVPREKRNKNHRLARYLCLVVVALALFCYGAGSIDRTSADSQRKTLERAVNSGVTYCYAIEGQYPESVEYLEKNYSLTYDKKRFFIGYRLQGSNIKPAITIIQLD